MKYSPPEDFVAFTTAFVPYAEDFWGPDFADWVRAGFKSVRPAEKMAVYEYIRTIARNADSEGELLAIKARTHLLYAYKKPREFRDWLRKVLTVIDDDIAQGRFP